MKQKKLESGAEPPGEQDARSGKGQDEARDEELRLLADEWRATRNPVKSSAAAAAMHPAYQRIIGKGRAALPFILRELQAKPDHWFWALGAITGLDPVPESDRGNIQKMADAWISWGKTNRII
jgi:hypothetical protein